MRVLLDFNQVTGGGGVQVALSVLHNAARTRQVRWFAVLSPELRAEARAGGAEACEILELPGRTAIERYLNGLHIRAFERRVRPDVSFSVFGPVAWRADSPHLQGFAIPRLIYPDVVLPRLAPGAAFRQAARTTFRRSLVRRAEFLVVESETIRQRLERHLRIDRRKVFVVRNSYSPLFAQRLREVAVRARDPGGTFAILVPSGYYPHKNLEILPRAAVALRRLLGARPFRFVMTLPTDGRPWAALRESAAAMGVLGHFESVGTVPHGAIAELYRQADCMCLPTLLECSTAVYPESFMAGVPVATSRRDFALEFCGEAAAYFDPREPRDIAEKLALLADDRRLRDALVGEGERQLRRAYPAPEEKWEAQLQVLQRVAAREAATADPGRAGGEGA